MVPSSSPIPNPPAPTCGNPERSIVVREAPASGRGMPTSFSRLLRDELPDGANVPSLPASGLNPLVSNREEAATTELACAADDVEEGSEFVSDQQWERGEDLASALMPLALAESGVPPPLPVIPLRTPSGTRAESEVVEDPSSADVAGSPGAESRAAEGVGQVMLEAAALQSHGPVRSGVLTRSDQSVNRKWSIASVASPTDAENASLVIAGDDAVMQPQMTDGDTTGATGARLLVDCRAVTRAHDSGLPISGSVEIETRTMPAGLNTRGVETSNAESAEPSDAAITALASLSSSLPETRISKAVATESVNVSLVQPSTPRESARTGRHPSMAAETAADDQSANPHVENARSDFDNIEKKDTGSVDSKLVAKWFRPVGTEVANGDVVMRGEHSIKAGQEMVGGAQAPAAALHLSGPEARPAAGSAPWTAVGRVLDAADVLWATNRAGVDLKVQFENEGVWVRVDYRDGEVTATFRTDSPELRDRLAVAWQQHLSSVGEPRPYRFADPLFVGGSPASADGFAAHVASDSRSGGRDRSGQSSDESFVRGRTSLRPVGGSAAQPSALSAGLSLDRGSLNRLRAFA